MFESGHKAWSGFDLVVIAASLGGLRACRAVTEALLEGFPAAVVYVQHRAPSPETATAALLRRSTGMRVVEAEDGTSLEAGTLYVAPADRQVVVDGARRLVAAGGDRCLADPLLASAAAAYGRRTIAVVLTGRLDDGADGVVAVKRAGGRVLVQQPDTAESPGMPNAALATGCFDLVLPPASLGRALVALVSVPGAAELFEVRAHPWQPLIA